MTDVEHLLAADPATLDYEQAREGLSAIVARLEGGEAPLEESLRLWETGEALARRCSELLDKAEARLAAAADTRPDQAPPVDDVPF